MRKHLIQFLLVAVLSVFSAAAFAQTTVRGQLVDSETGEPLVGAAVMVEGTTQGSVTDIDGYFKQSVASNATLLFKYVGYKDQKKKITQKGASVDLGAIPMEPDAVMLKDVVITSSIAVARKTPVAVSTVDPVFIEDKIGSQELPQILKSTPGVYASNEGGGFGDSNIKIRGFKSEYVAMMINGVPMNGMENQKVYMSNWGGLIDVASSIQVQRGLGASKVSTPSVGGSQNIITKTTDAKKGGFISYGMGNDGYSKVMFSVSSGLTKDGWAFTLLGARDKRDGYIQGTESEAYTWFMSIAKRINDNHQLSFTAFGAPQWHNQRNMANGLNIKEYQRVKQWMGEESPYRYNSTFGYRNGQVMNSSRNEYHKPQMSLNHLWQINHKSSLSTAAYMSIGTGAGYSGTGVTGYTSSWYGTASDGTVNTQFRCPDGTFDYDAVDKLNADNYTNPVNVSGMPGYKGSLMIMNKASNDHFWTGLISTYTTKFGDYFDFYGGIDFRYYKGLHKNVITDLFGGQYYVDSYNRKSVLAENSVNAGVKEISRNGVDEKDGFIWPSYVEDIMGPELFDYGYGPFRWVCLSGKPEDLAKTDRAAMECIDVKRRGQDLDNYNWIKDAGKNQLVVGTQARILYQDAAGRLKIALRFNEMVRNGEVGPIMLGRDHHDVSGTDSPFRETSNIKDGSNVMADMAVQCFAGNCARGMSLVALHNGGGVGIGKAVNGGFGMVCDGSSRVDEILRSSMLWDVMGGVARRSWARNEHAMETSEAFNLSHGDTYHITMPYLVDEELIKRIII